MSEHSDRHHRTVSLSARLLILTVVFVMIAEVMIWTPSVARFRKNFIEDYIARSYLSMVALDSMPETQPNQDLEMELLHQTEALAIIVNRPDRRMLMVGGDMPPEVDVTVDLRGMTFMDWVMGAFETFSQTESRVVRAVGMPPKQPEITVEVLFDESLLKTAMLEFSWRIFTLSLVISLITATLLYVSLQWMIIRPIRRLTQSMTRFRDNPEDATRIVPPSTRSDEIGVAEKELAGMQHQVQVALKQKDRLAALGAAMAKINHDLRNTLATAVLVSDKLQNIQDPEVKRVTPRLMKAIDRAIDLCSQTLNYATEDTIRLRPRRFPVRDLIDEVAATLTPEGDAPAPGWDIDVPDDIDIVADRRHLLRALHNLCGNAVEAGAVRISIGLARGDGVHCFEVTDDGPGLPQKARDNLFKPFAGSGRKGGTGLGLVIVRDIVRAHGGEVHLISTGDGGTRFRLDIPDDIEPAEAATADDQAAE